MEHIYGPNTEEVRLEASGISGMLKEGLLASLSGAKARETLLLATADHGQILSPPEEMSMLNRYRRLANSLAKNDAGERILPWGAPRDLYLSVAEGRVDETVEYLARALGGAASVLKTSDAISSGLFGRGTATPTFLRRVGNVMILPTGTRSIWYRHPGVRPPDMKGRHGGLHPDEMTVPFAAAMASSLMD
jgi:predicted AlkP superfamily pyrophosphatase or phosphodiesterase